MSEYILDTNDGDDIKDIQQDELTADEKLVMEKLEELSKLCSDKKIPCFVTAKFKSQTDPSAAWFFGDDVTEAHKCFVNDFAALFLHITSKLTLTKIQAFNPQTGKEVYSVEPDRNESN